MKKVRELFKHNLIELRGDRTLKEIAAGADIPYRTYQNMEEGVIPQDETMEKIANFHGVPQGRFFLDPELAAKPAIREPGSAEILEIVARGLKALEEPKTASLSPEDVALLDAVHRIDKKQLEFLLRPIFLAAESLKHSKKDKQTG